MVAPPLQLHHGEECKAGATMSEESTPSPEAGADAASDASPVTDSPSAAESPSPQPPNPEPPNPEASVAEAAAASPPRPGALRRGLGSALRLLSAPLRLLPFDRKRPRSTVQPEISIEPPLGGPAAQAAAAADTAAPPAAGAADAPARGATAADANPLGEESSGGEDGAGADVPDPGLLANPRVQLVLAALAGAIIAVGGGIGGGFLERVESDDALIDEAAAEVVVDGDADHASEQADHGVPSAPGPGSTDASSEHDAGAESEAVADHESAQAQAADAESAASSADARSTVAASSPDYLRGYFDGQSCALLDPDTGECLTPADVITRLNTAFTSGWAAALQSLGAVPPPNATATPATATPATATDATASSATGVGGSVSGAGVTTGGGQPRIIQLTRIEIEDLSAD